MSRSDVLLGTISDVEYGVTASADSNQVGPKFLRITDIQNGKVDWQNVPYCKCSSREHSNARLRVGDILFARTGATTGKSFLIRSEPVDAVFASYLIRVRPTSEIAPAYLAHFFQSKSYWAQINKEARGAGQPGVNSTTLKALRVALPPLNEQRRIAAILDTAEAVRSKRRAAVTLFDLLSKTLFREMFGDLKSNSMGWSNGVFLGDVAELVSGITKGRKLNGKATREVPYLAVINVQDRSLNLETVKTIEATKEEIDRYRLLPNDLLLTEGGDPDKLGRGTLWSGEFPEAIHQNHIFRVRLKVDSISPVFLNWLVGSDFGKAYFLRQAKQTTGIATINMGQLKALPLLVPPISLQLRFAETIAMIENCKSTHQIALGSLDDAIAALQATAFSGGL